MSEPLDAELSLDISGSLASVESLGSSIEGSLSEAVESFSTEMEAAVSGIPPIDLAVEADTSAIEPSISGEVDAADSSIEVNVDDVTGTEDISGEIEAAVDAADSTVVIDADTSAAEQAVGDLGAASAEAAPQIQQSVDATSGLSGAAGLATGGMSGLGGAVGSLGGRAAATAGVIGAAGAGLSMFFNEAVEAKGATQRFNQVLGENRDAVENLRNIEGLNTNLGDLALKLGSDDDKIRSVAARLYELATASGKTTSEASGFTQQMIALGARAVAINPMLGDVGDVTDSLGTALVKGGKFASKFGLDLSAQEIVSRALIMTHKKHADELSFVEKAMAGAAIASEKYGGNLDSVIARGSENAITKHRRLKQTIVENIEALGTPLVAPIFELMEAAIPTVALIGKLLSTLGQAAIPVVTAALDVLNPILAVVAEILEAIPAPVLAATTAFLLFRAPLAGVSGLMRSLGGEAMGMSDKLGRSVAGIGLASMGFQELTKHGGNAALGIVEMTAAGALLGSVIPGVGTALGAAAGAVAGVTVKLVSGGESVDDYRRRFEKLGGALDSFTKKEAAKKFLNELGTSDAYKLWTGNVRAITDELEAAARSNPANAEKIVAGLRRYRDELDRTKPAFTAAEFDIFNAAVARGTDELNRQIAAKGQADIRNKELTASGNAVAESDQAQIEASEQLTQAIDSYVQTASGGLPTVSSAFDNAKGAAESFGAALSPEVLLSGLQDALTQTLNFTKNLQTIFDAGFTDIGALLQSKGAEAGGATTQALADAIRSNNPLVAQQLNEQAALVTVAGMVAAENATVVGGKVVANTDAQYARLSPLVRFYMGLTAESVSTGGLDVETAAGVAGVDATSAFTAGIAPTPAAAGAAVGGAASAVRGKQGDVAGAAGSVGAGAAGGFGQGIAPLPGVAGAAVAGAGSQIAANGSTVAENQARGAGYGIGSSFGYGMQQGISDTIGGVREYARQMGAAAVKGAQEGAVVHSPSRATIKIGHQIGEGLVAGMRDSEAAVSTAAKSLLHRAVTLASAHAAGYGVPAGAYTMPGAGTAGRSGTTVVFNIRVDGVSSPAVARNVGEQIGEGAVDALTRRGYVVTARLG